MPPVPPRELSCSTLLKLARGTCNKGTRPISTPATRDTIKIVPPTVTIHVYLGSARQPVEPKRFERPQHSGRNRRAEYACNERKDQPFDSPAGGDTSAAGTERHARAQLLGTQRGARQRQVRDIQRAHEEHERCAAPKKIKRSRHVADEDVLQRAPRVCGNRR